jgi:hypothetical protein
MDAFRREHEKSVAVGNMGVNAKGDKVENGRVVKTIDQISKENHMTKTTIIKASLKGPQPDSPELITDQKVVQQRVNDVKSKANKKSESSNIDRTAAKEVELPSGDIIIEKDDNGTI